MFFDPASIAQGLRAVGPLDVVSIPLSTQESVEGWYFLGQTGDLVFGGTNGAWGGLFNPPGSGVVLYLSTLSISNPSDYPLTARIVFNAAPAEEGVVSPHVTPGNTALTPLPVPQVKLRYGDASGSVPSRGIVAFDRIVPPHSTVAADKDGKLIFPQGATFLVYLDPPGVERISARVAFGWWEKAVGT